MVENTNNLAKSSHHSLPFFLPEFIQLLHGMPRRQSPAQCWWQHSELPSGYGLTLQSWQPATCLHSGQAEKKVKKQSQGLIKGWTTVNSLSCKHLFSAATCGINSLPCFQMSEWGPKCSHAQDLLLVSTQVARSFPLPSNLPLSPAVSLFRLLIQHTAIRSDQLWQMVNHKYCCQS